MKKVIIEKEIIINLYNKTNSAYKVAEQLGINVKTAYRLLKEYGISSVGTQGARKNYYDENYFETIDSSEKAYWLGFIYADGCVYEGNNGNSYRLQINLKESDKPHLEKFQESIGSSYKIGYNANTKSVSLKINSTKMCKDLINLGVIPRKSLVCTMPNIPYNLKSHFVRGLFDGDGTITMCNNVTKKKAYPHFSICTGSEDFATSLHELLPGCKMYIQKRKHLLYSIETSDTDYIKDIYDWLYEDATVWLDRKHDKYTEIVNI